MGSSTVDMVAPDPAKRPFKRDCHRPVTPLAAIPGLVMSACVLALPRDRYHGVAATCPSLLVQGIKRRSTVNWWLMFVTARQRFPT